MKAPATRTATRDAVGLQLLFESVRLSGTARIRVFGSSMLPNILPGDSLVIRQERGRLPCLGEIIVFARGNRLFAHRVIEHKEQGGIYCYVTRGDSLRENDAPVFPHELLGRVTLIVRGRRHIAPHATLTRTLGSIALRNCDFLQRCLLWLLRRQMRERCPT